MVARANHWRHIGGLLAAALAVLTGCHPLGVLPSYRLPPPQAAHPSMPPPHDEPATGPPAPEPISAAAGAGMVTDCDSAGAVDVPCPPLTPGIPLWLPAWPKLPRIPLPGETPDEAPWPRFHPVPTRPVFQPPPEEIPLPVTAPLEPLPPKQLASPPAPLPLPELPSGPPVPLKAQ